MKKFLISISLFLSPLILLFILSLLFYSAKQGDLIRMGYLPKNNDYREKFRHEFNRPIYYYDINSFNLKRHTGSNVLIVGDSFSEQEAFGYNNYLAEYKDINVIHFKRMKSGDNPIENIYGIINGNILDSLSIDFVILQSVERHFVSRAVNIKKDFKISREDQVNLAIKCKKITNPSVSFPPPELWKFPLYSILYNYNDNAYFSDVFKVKTDRMLFTSSNTSNLLFYREDLNNVKLNNSQNSVDNLNNELNELCSILINRNIKLIVLPSPDKYDMYYSLISKKANYPEPLFFDILCSLPKNYTLIDSKQILSQYLESHKDIYFYDDTHWSPIASKIIAKKISSIILSKRKHERTIE